MVGRRLRALYKGFIPTTNQAGLALACMFLRVFNNSELSVSASTVLHSVRLCFMKLADRCQHAQNLSNERIGLCAPAELSRRLMSIRTPPNARSRVSLF